MLSIPYLSVKSVKIDISAKISQGGRCIFPKVGEWVTRRDRSVGNVFEVGDDRNKIGQLGWNTLYNEQRGV